MIVIGCDFHPSWQQICWVDTATGETEEKRRQSESGSSEELSADFARLLDGLRRFWQRRYYDFNVYSAQKLIEKLDYIHANPVKRGLVVHPKDWPWSSWTFYATGEQGVVRIDPTGEEQRREEAPPSAKGAKGRAPSLPTPR